MSTTPEPFALLNQAISALQMGDLEQSMALVEQSLSIDPNRPDSWTLKGMLARRLHRVDEALEAYQQAILLRPDYADAHANQGYIFRERQEWPRAIDSFRRAVFYHPENVGWWNILSDSLRLAGQPEEAEIALDEALARAPATPDSWILKGNLRIAQDDPVAAVPCYQKDLELRPDYGEAHYNLGVALTKAGRHREAAASYRYLVTQQPNHLQSLLDLAIACHKSGDLPESELRYRQIVVLDPNHHVARWNRALVLLLMGNIEAGFQEYECRYHSNSPNKPRSFGRPRWTGEAFSGQCLLIFTEQGFGDTLQMLRYVPLVKARGGEIILETTPGLLRLVRHQPGVQQVVVPGDPMPKVDLEISLMSLPHVLGTCLDTIPSQVPYLQVPEEATARWRDRVLAFPGPRIGIVWAGKPSHQLDAARSPRLATLLPLIQHTKATFFILQRGSGRRDLWDIELPPHCVDIAADLRDFSETAAILQELDLMITVDTSVAHLSGALGRPTWVLLHHEPDWRWMMDRKDSPWYPSVRLFRQPSRGRWDIVVDRLREALLQEFPSG